MTCLFCRMVSRELAHEIIYEDDVCLATMDIHPRSPGHCFVIPKRHAQNMGEVPEGDMGALFQGVRNAATLIKRALNPDGLTIGINEGRAGGQEIDHLHIHIMPRWNGDGAKGVQSVVSNTPKESIVEIAAKIRKVGKSQ